VICIRTADQTARLVDRNGVSILNLKQITSSRVDKDCPNQPGVNCPGGFDDHITPVGSWLVTCVDRVDGDGVGDCNPIADNLKWVIQFENGNAFNTSLHAYRAIGRNLDSNGCVRTNPARAKKLWLKVASYLDAGHTVEVKVNP
jgi:hypothetical protein